MDVIAIQASTIMPQVFAALNSVGINETMSVSRTAQTADGMGGFTDGTVSAPYTNIPVIVNVDAKGKRLDLQGKPLAVQSYILEFPVVDSNGSTIDVNLATDKFIVAAHSPFAARTYKIIAPIDDTGPVNQFICVKED